MNAVAYAAMQLLPVFIGIAIMFLIRSVRMARRRIRIDITGIENYKNGGPAEEGLHMQEGGEVDASSYRKQQEEESAIHPDSECCDKGAREVALEELTREMLIINGMYRGSMQDYRSAAFSRLGIIDAEDVHSAPHYLRRWDKRQMTVFIFGEGRRGFNLRLLRYGESEGILLAYALLHRLEFIGV